LPAAWKHRGDESLLFQLGQVPVHRVGGLQADPLADFTDRRRIATAGHGLSDDSKNPLLAVGQAPAHAGGLLDPGGGAVQFPQPPGQGVLGLLLDVELLMRYLGSAVQGLGQPVGQPGGSLGLLQQGVIVLLAGAGEFIVSGGEDVAEHAGAVDAPVSGGVQRAHEPAMAPHVGKLAGEVDMVDLAVDFLGGASDAPAGHPLGVVELAVVGLPLARLVGMIVAGHGSLLLALIVAVVLGRRAVARVGGASCRQTRMVTTATVSWVRAACSRGAARCSTAGTGLLLPLLVMIIGGPPRSVLGLAGRLGDGQAPCGPTSRQAGGLGQRGAGRGGRDPAAWPHPAAASSLSDHPARAGRLASGSRLGGLGRVAGLGGL
jgi:hypothetical protein